MSGYPDDDYERRVDDYRYHRERQIDRDYERLRQERRHELDRLRSPEATLIADGYGSGHSEPGGLPTAVEPRYQVSHFVREDARLVLEKVAAWGRFRAAPLFTMSEAEFDHLKRDALEAIERHLPPSYAREVFAAACNITIRDSDLTISFFLADRIRRLKVEAMTAWLDRTDRPNP